MSDFEIRIDDREVRQMLKRAPQQIQRASRAAMSDATSLLMRDLTTYPPAPPNSTYARTRTLGRSWSREISGDGLRGFVGSNASMAPYNRWVMDEERQATVHVGRWQTAQSVKRRRERDIQRIFSARLRQYVTG